MAATVFFQGSSELATLTNTFSVTGVPTDPTTVSLAITDPTGTTTTYTYAASQITRSATGVYTKDITCSTAGQWTYTWTGTGTAADVQSGTWDVFETTLGRLYATVDALKSRLGITTTSSDFELHGACFAASRAIEQECERTFWRTASSEVRTVEPCDYYWLKLPEFNDLTSVTTLKTDGDGDGVFETTWTTSDYQLLPYNTSAGPESRPYTKIKCVGSRLFPVPYNAPLRNDRVQITGVFGWPTVPWAIKQAALILAADTFKLKDAPFGVASFGDFAMRVGNNPRTMSFLAPYKRNVLKVA
jgi:hypothetical protein